MELIGKGSHAYQYISVTPELCRNTGVMADIYFFVGSAKVPTYVCRLYVTADEYIFVIKNSKNTHEDTEL